MFISSGAKELGGKARVDPQLKMQMPDHMPGQRGSFVYTCPGVGGYERFTAAASGLPFLPLLK